MNLDKELRISGFNKLLREYIKTSEDELEELKKQADTIFYKKTLIEEAISLNNNISPDPENLSSIREYGQLFEDEFYDMIADRYREDNRLDEYVHRLQNIYSTKEILKTIPLDKDTREKLIKRFPVIKIWHDQTSSDTCGNFVVEYYKHHFNISTRPDIYFFDLNYERIDKNDFNKKRDKWNIVDLYQNFDYHNLDELQTYLDCQMFEKNIPEDLFLGLLIIAYFFLFNYKRKANITLISEFLEMLKNIPE